MAIALHKLPEGMAAGVSVSDVSNTSWTVTLGLSLQNVPEGMVIIAPLLIAGVKPMRTFIIALCVGLLEIVGVWIGYGLGTLLEALLPVLFGFE